MLVNHHRHRITLLSECFLSYLIGRFIKKGRALAIAPLSSLTKQLPQRRSGTWRAPSSVAHTCIPFPVVTGRPTHLPTIQGCVHVLGVQLLCDMFVFKIIPMLNPDGVIVGNYRCSLTGRDLNRAYRIAMRESFPSISHVKSMIKT